MMVRIKKLSGRAVMPAKAHTTDAGFDLTATRKWCDEYGNLCYGTDLAFEIPEGYVGYIFPRSSNSKKDLTLSNSVGVIDSGYRGEVTFKFKVSWRISEVGYVLAIVTMKCTPYNTKSETASANLSLCRFPILSLRKRRNFRRQTEVKVVTEAAEGNEVRG